MAALLAQQGAAGPTTSPASVAGVPAARAAHTSEPDAVPAAPVPAAPVPAAPVPAASAAAAPADPAPEPVAVSADARAMWGPLTKGLSVPNDLDLSDRGAALEQLDVSAAANSRLVNIARD